MVSRDSGALQQREYIDFSPPCLGDEEISEVADTLRSPWITTGPKTLLFENQFAEYVGAPAALALNSCTAALHTALAALGVGPGDEVITSTLTFAATANVVEHVGARPVFVDVEPRTLNLDPELVARAITSRTKVIIPVHYAGHPAELDRLRELADFRHITIVEDAAHALPASFRGEKIGSSPNPVAFSFYATKNLTTGEGGMLTGEPKFLEQARVIALHGMTRDAWKRYQRGGSWQYDVVFPGFKYNMTDIQASIGLWQLRKLAQFHERRLSIAARYTEAFSKNESLEVPHQFPHAGHAWHLYVLRIRPETLTIDRDKFIEELVARRVGTSVHFTPVHMHSWYRNKYGYTAESFPVAYENYSRMMSLPIHPRLEDQHVSDVIDAVLEVVGATQR